MNKAESPLVEGAEDQEMKKIQEYFYIALRNVETGLTEKFLRRGYYSRNQCKKYKVQFRVLNFSVIIGLDPIIRWQDC